MIFLLFWYKDLNIVLSSDDFNTSNAAEKNDVVPS